MGKKDYGTLLEHLYEPWWEEAVLLFAGFGRDATGLIQKIREKEKEDKKFEEDIFCRNLILQGKCIVDADYTSVQLRNQICKELWSLHQTGGFSSLRRRAMEILALIKPDNIIDLLIRDLKDEDILVRGMAAGALGRIGSEKTVNPLITALKDEVSYVRWMAAGALGNIGSEKTVAPLIEALKDEDSLVRGGTAEVLGSMASEKTVAPLIEALKDEDSNVRMWAAEVLGSMASEKTVNPLIEALKDEDSYVRGMAAGALGNIGSEKTVNPLIKTLKDESKGLLGKVKDSAFDSLEKIIRKSEKKVFIHRL